MDIPSLLIESFSWKFRAEKKWTSQAIAQLAEEDIVWAPTAESNSIANLVAHIWGTVHQRVEIVFFDVLDNRDREKEFEKGLVMSKEEALKLISESFDIIIQVLEGMKSNPEQGLFRQPYIKMPPLTNSALNNNSRVLDVMIQMLHHLPGHTAQIVYIAKMRRGQLDWQYN